MRRCIRRSTERCAVTLLLLFSERPAECCLVGCLLIRFRLYGSRGCPGHRWRVALIPGTVALLLLLSKRGTQRFLMRGIFALIRRGRRLAGRLLCLTLGRQFNAIRGQLPAGRNAYRVRPRQFRADALFHLRIGVTHGTEGRHKGRAGLSAQIRLTGRPAQHTAGLRQFVAILLGSREIKR